MEQKTNVLKVKQGLNSLQVLVSAVSETSAVKQISVRAEKWDALVWMSSSLQSD